MSDFAIRYPFAGQPRYGYHGFGWPVVWTTYDSITTMTEGKVGCNHCTETEEEDTFALYEWVYVTYDEEGNGTVANKGGQIFAWNEEDARSRVSFKLGKETQTAELEGEILVRAWEW